MNKIGRQHRTTRSERIKTIRNLLSGEQTFESVANNIRAERSSRPLIITDMWILNGDSDADVFSVKGLTMSRKEFDAKVEAGELNIINLPGKKMQ